MSDLDRYDVEAMIRDALYPLRADLRGLERDLETIRQDLGSERVNRQDAIESLERVLSSRTEHLA